MRFSIVVPVHNTAPYLERCIEALLWQECPRDEYEILMVDNNSTDESPRILLNARGIRALSESKPGSYCARNRALREARGEIIAFTDSDCYPAKGWLHAIESAMSEPGVQVVMGKRRPAQDSGLMRLITDYEIKKDELALSSNDPRLYYGFTNNMGVRRTAWDRYGPFEERMRGGDTIFVRRVVEGEGCAAVAFQPAMLVIHGEMEGASTYYRKIFTYGRSRRQYQNVIRTRALSGAERRRSFLATVREGGYTIWESITLGAALGMGMAAWRLGSLSHHFSKRPVK